MLKSYEMMSNFRKNNLPPKNSPFFGKNSHFLSASPIKLKKSENMQPMLICYFPLSETQKLLLMKYFIAI